MEIAILFLLGLSVGSFLNVLIDRLPKDQSIIYPPSSCDHCKKRLLWYDLIPVLSFLLLRGKCRSCHSPISWQYPIVELLTGLFFVLTVFYLSTGSIKYQVLSIKYIGELLFFLFIVSSFIVIFFTDLKYGIIPDKVVYPAIIISSLYILLNTQYIILNHVLAGAGAFLFFFAIYHATGGRGMGFGDVKLAFLLGLIFGFPKIVFTLYIAFLTGAFFSIILLVLGKKRLKETIVFGPFLVIASLSVLFFGEYFRTLWFLPV